MKVLLLSALLIAPGITKALPLPMPLLVGGAPKIVPQVVNLYVGKQTVCTGSVVGVRPLTVITASHCFFQDQTPQNTEETTKNIQMSVVSKDIKFKVAGLTPKVLLGIANNNVEGSDVAVLVFDENAKIPGVTAENVFTLPSASHDMKEYTGSVSLCGFGHDTDFVKDETGLMGSSKCGQSLFMKKHSYGPLSFKLFSEKRLKCIFKDNYAKVTSLLKEPYAGISVGDSGGPLYLSADQKVLLGVARETGFDKGNPAFLKACGIAPFEAYQYLWTSLSLDNPIARAIFKTAVEKFNADITGL